LDLSTAASYFTNTTISGWNGTSWVPNVGTIAILPSDRFVSFHEFDTNCQYALTEVSSTALDDYSIVRVDVTDQVFLVGFKTSDVNGDQYSKFYLLRRADSQGELLSQLKTYAASGVVNGATRQSVGLYYCDVEHVTSATSSMVKTSKYSDSLIFMPSDSVFDTSNEIRIGDMFYEVRDVYASSGFKVCRAIGKKQV
jgi:hypothetical protein